MSERRAIVHPPSETGGRLVRREDRRFGTAHTPYYLPSSDLHPRCEGATEVRLP
ncbi:hypothetical protein ACFXKY_32950 [Streptomyces canus]|uniref:hypothetical protein n=1 Tax=Streptomyces canus TaxID=58343 RepID=UPI0036C4F061